MVPIGRQARLWPLFVLLAFIGNGLLHASLAVVLLVLGPLALVCNRPKD